MRYPDDPTGAAPDIQFEFADIDRIQDQGDEDDWDFQLTQLETGAFRGRYTGWQLSNLRFANEHYSHKINILGAAPPSEVSIVVPNPGSGPMHFNQEPMQHGSLIVLQPGQNVDCTTFGAVDITTFQIDRSYFEHTVQTLCDDDATDSMVYGQIIDAKASLVSDAVEMLPTSRLTEKGQSRAADGVAAEQYFVSLVTEHFVSHIADSTDGTASHRANTATQSYLVARRAKDFIEANLHRSILRREICTACDAKLRTLHDSFMRCYGVPPIAYHRYRRLKQAHEQLKNGHVEGLTVTGVALDRGFESFGRFAAQYKAIFGEPPSSTLLNSR